MTASPSNPEKPSPHLIPESESPLATTARLPGAWLCGGLLAVFALCIYLPYVLYGSLTYDDWAVCLESRTSAGFVEFYLKFFRGAFQNRPLAPIYYAITANAFGFSPVGYIITNVMIWLAATAIIAIVVARTMGILTAAIFFLLAALPTFSTTVMFSPAMQSIGSVSILLWAVSFLMLDRYLVRPAKFYLLVSWCLILATLLTYEITIPLLVLSGLYPFVCPSAATNKFGLRNVLHGILLFIIPIIAALGIAYLYQKVYLPRYMADISRLRGTTLHSAVVISNHWLDVFRKEIPSLLMAAPSFHLRHSGLDTLLLGLAFPTAAAWGVLWKMRDLHVRISIVRTLLILSVLLLGLVGVLFMHMAANVPPSTEGYINRGLSSMSILISLILAVVASYLIGKHKMFLLPAVCLVGLWIQAFVAQRDNYIEAGILAHTIADDAAGLVRERELSDIFLFGNVPQYLVSNFNNETVFSDEVTDFAGAVKARTAEGQVQWGGSVTKQMIANNRVLVDGDMVSVIPYLPPTPVGDWWFYEYDREEGRGQIMKVRNSAHFGEIVDGIARTGKAPFP